MMLTKKLAAAVLLLAIAADAPAATSSAPGRKLPENAAQSGKRAPACPRFPLKYDPENEQLKLRAMLAKHQFAALDTELSAFRAKYAKSECSDRLFGTVFLALMDGAPGMKKTYDAWIAKAPGSAHAYTARGMHFHARAGYARGQKWARETSDERFRRMHGFVTQAEADLSRALAIDPTHGVAMAEVIMVKSLDGSPRDLVGAYEKFSARAPNSYLLGHAMMGALEPKWGGSVELMLQFAQMEATRPGNNADTRGLVSLAHCQVAEYWSDRDQFDKAHEELAAGMKQPGGPDFDCYFSQGMVYRAERKYAQSASALANYRQLIGPVNFLSMEADALRVEGRYGEAELLFTRGINFKTESPTLFCGRADTRFKLGKLAAARQDLAIGLRTDPLDSYCLRVQKKIQEKAAGP